MLKGEKVYLDTIEPNDLETLRKWRNLPNYRKFKKSILICKENGMNQKW